MGDCLWPTCGVFDRNFASEKEWSGARFGVRLAAGIISSRLTFARLHRQRCLSFLKDSRIQAGLELDS